MVIAFSYLLLTSRMITNFIVEGLGNIAKLFVHKLLQSSMCWSGFPIVPIQSLAEAMEKLF